MMMMMMMMMMTMMMMMMMMMMRLRLGIELHDDSDCFQNIRLQDVNTATYDMEIGNTEAVNVSSQSFTVVYRTPSTKLKRNTRANMNM
jgi:hypothetical protein